MTITIICYVLQEGYSYSIMVANKTLFVVAMLVLAVVGPTVARVYLLEDGVNHDGNDRTTIENQTVNTISEPTPLTQTTLNTSTFHIAKPPDLNSRIYKISADEYHNVVTKNTSSIGKMDLVNGPRRPKNNDPHSPFYDSSYLNNSDTKLMYNATSFPYGNTNINKSPLGNRKAVDIALLSRPETGFQDRSDTDIDEDLNYSRQYDRSSLNYSQEDPSFKPVQRGNQTYRRPQTAINYDPATQTDRFVPKKTRVRFNPNVPLTSIPSISLHTNLNVHRPFGSASMVVPIAQRDSNNPTLNPSRNQNVASSRPITQNVSNGTPLNSITERNPNGSSLFPITERNPNNPFSNSIHQRNTNGQTSNPTIEIHSESPSSNSVTQRNPNSHLFPITERNSNNPSLNSTPQRNSNSPSLFSITERNQNDLSSNSISQRNPNNPSLNSIAQRNTNSPLLSSIAQRNPNSPLLSSIAQRQPNSQSSNIPQTSEPSQPARINSKPTYFETSKRPVLPNRNEQQNSQINNLNAQNNAYYNTRQPSHTLQNGGTSNPIQGPKSNISQKPYNPKPSIRPFVPQTKTQQQDYQKRLTSTNINSDRKSSSDAFLASKQQLQSNIISPHQPYRTHISQDGERYRPSHPVQNTKHPNERNQNSNINLSERFQYGESLKRDPNFGYDNAALSNRQRPSHPHHEVLSTSLKSVNPTGHYPTGLPAGHNTQYKLMPIHNIKSGSANYPSYAKIPSGSPIRHSQTQQFHNQPSGQFVSSIPKDHSNQFSSYEQSSHHNGLHVINHIPSNNPQYHQTHSGIMSHGHPSQFNPYLHSGQSHTAPPHRISSSLPNPSHETANKNTGIHHMIPGSEQRIPQQEQEHSPSVYKTQSHFAAGLTPVDLHEYAAPSAHGVVHSSPVKPLVEYDKSMSEYNTGLNAVLRKPLRPISVYSVEETPESSDYPSPDINSGHVERPSLPGPPYGDDDEIAKFGAPINSNRGRNSEAGNSKPYENDDEEDEEEDEEETLPRHPGQSAFNSYEPSKSSLSSYDAPLIPNANYDSPYKPSNSYESDDKPYIPHTVHPSLSHYENDKPSYPPYAPKVVTKPSSVHDVLSESENPHYSNSKIPFHSSSVPSSSYGVPYDTPTYSSPPSDTHSTSHGSGAAVQSFVKTDKEGNFKWGVRHKVGSHYAGHSLAAASEARIRRDGHHQGVTGPVHTFVKTDKHAHFKWGVRHHVGHQYAG